MDFSVVFLKLIEQILAYICGFGLSEMFIKQYNLTAKQEFIYYVLCGILALCILFHSKDIC